MLLFIPLDAGELAAWTRNGTHHPRAAFAVTGSLRAAFGFGDGDDEDAEHTVLHIAGLDSLLRTGRRLVAVVDGSAEPVPGAEFGDVRAGELPWAGVTALFADSAPGAAGAVQPRLTGRSLEQAWEDPVVEEFLQGHELLWHGPSEWDTLTTR